MERRSFVIGGLATLIFAPFAAEAQTAKKVWRIGYLSQAPVDGDKAWYAGFEQGLRELGYVPGENILVERRHAAQRRDRFEAMAAELVRRKVDVIVVYGAVEAVKKVAGDIPVVFTVNADPVGTGIVASLSRPGANITGLSDFHAGLVPKRLELLKEIAPSLSRVAVLFNPTVPHAGLQWKNVQAAAPTFGLTVRPFEVRGPEGIDEAFARIEKERPGALLIIPDPSWFLGNQKRIAGLALEAKLPAIATVREWADAGGLISYGTSFHDLWRRSATYVDKILKGAKPADLPVEQPTKFELLINFKTAKAIGVTVPRSLLLRADHVIE